VGAPAAEEDGQAMGPSETCLPGKDLVGFMGEVLAGIWDTSRATQAQRFQQ
jgi:hypothetical protein